MTFTDGEDFVLRPVMNGLCKYESLLDGTLDLGDIARLNDALDLRIENEARVDEWRRLNNKT